MRKLVWLALLVLAGCSGSHDRTAAVQSQGAPPMSSGPSGGFAWARSDGQRMAGNTELTAAAQADIAACGAEAPPRAARGVAGEPCMRERGYYIRPVE